MSQVASGRIDARPTAVLLGSALFHAVLLMLLARYLAHTTTYGEAPAMQVSLVRAPLRPDPIDREAPAPAPPDRADRRSRNGPAPSILSSPTLAGDPAPLLSGAGADEGARLRGALRGLGGCDRAGLSRDERERCEARRWVGAAPAPQRVNLDPSGRYAVNPDPFLSRRPAEGCRLRASGDVDPTGDDQNARVGITCVKRF